jgi:hypothetical protein
VGIAPQDRLTSEIWKTLFKVKIAADLVIVYFHDHELRAAPRRHFETAQKDLEELRELLAEISRDPGLTAPALFAEAILIETRISKAST